MTMKIIVVNDDANRTVEVDTVQTDSSNPEMVKAFVSQQDVIDPGKHKEFWLHGSQYVTVKEK